MPDENIQKGESQEEHEATPSAGDDEQKPAEEGSNTETKPVEPTKPEEEEMEPPTVTPGPPKEPLRDPRTGELLRDQSPGVPDSKWVGKHSTNDVENADVKEPKIAESDFGKD